VTEIETLSGRIAVVTGGAQGIGFEIAQGLLGSGASVLLADRAEEELERASRQLAALHGAGRVAHRAVDVADVVSARAALQHCFNVFGGVDILINNAGVVARGYVADMSPQDWSRVLAVNLTGAFLCSQAAIPLMGQRGGGVILNASSVSARVPDAGLSAYCASKAGVEVLTKVLAAEAAPLGIRVNAYAPGVTRTPMTEDIIASRADAKLRHICLKRFGEPSDIAALAVFLCSDAARFITGAVVAIDGGTMIVEHPWKPWNSHA